MYFCWAGGELVGGLGWMRAEGAVRTSGSRLARGLLAGLAGGAGGGLGRGPAWRRGRLRRWSARDLAANISTWRRAGRRRGARCRCRRCLECRAWNCIAVLAAVRSGARVSGCGRVRRRLQRASVASRCCGQRADGGELLHDLAEGELDGEGLVEGLGGLGEEERVEAELEELVLVLGGCGLDAAELGEDLGDASLEAIETGRGGRGRCCRCGRGHDRALVDEILEVVSGCFVVLAGGSIQWSLRSKG